MCVDNGKPHFSITMAPKSATLLYTQNIHKRHTGHLASLASPHLGLDALIIIHGQRHCSTWAEQSHMLSCLEPCALAIGKRLGSDAGAIPGADRSSAHLIRKHTISHSQFVLGRICLTSAIPILAFNSISGIAETISFCYSPHRT